MWDRLVYAAGGDVLQVFDLTDPARPVLVGTHALDGPTGPVAVSEEHVFVAAGAAVVILGR
jgi:hypothetical protein